MTRTIILSNTEESININDQLTFSDHIKNNINEYYQNIAATGLEPENVYELIMSEVELPLIQTTMTYTNNNQFKSAKTLGLNRGTFIKKLKHYGVL